MNILQRLSRSLNAPALLAAGVALAGATGCAHATGRLADISVVDRDSGRVLPTYYHHGEYWVAGRPGARYALRIANRSGGRLLAVTAVDGVNVISGDTAAYGQTGYVFAPWQSYDIDGWRKSDAEVAAFLFTAAPASYAARTGRPFNIGVIGVALFRERAPEPPPAVAAPYPPVSPSASAGAPPAGNSALAEQSADRSLAAGAQRFAPEARAKLGTGHGEREYSAVEHTGFDRRSDAPDEVIRIRYDSVENLVAMGVIRRPTPPAYAPQAFPDAPVARYVPDPR